MELKEKLVLLFDYLKQYENMSKKIPTNIAEELDYVFLKNIPIDKNIDLSYGSSLDGENSKNSEEDILLSVKKPEFEPIPKLPESLNSWLEDGWDDWSKNATPKVSKVLVESYISVINEEKEIIPETLEYFADVSDRQKYFDKWIKEREKWVFNQKKIKKIRDFFVKLYNIYTDLNRESGQYEFVIANGLFEDIENNNLGKSTLEENNIIRYPLLSKRVKLSLEPQKNIIKIINTEKSSELYLDALSRVDGISLDSIKIELDELSQNDYHPLDQTETPDFLRRLLHRLSPDSKFIESPGIDKAEHGDRYTISLNPAFILRKKTDGSIRIFENIIEEIQKENAIPNVFRTIISNDEKYNVKEQGVVEEIKSLEDRLALASGESKDILMYNNANKEQLEIAKRVEQEDVVVIQGPPGTGKTHTIANLIGHFLSQGKRLLVTSYKEQALSVLRDKLPEEIQNLCVSDIENNFKELENSVNSISEMDTNTTPEKLHDEITQIDERRIQIMEELEEVRLKMFQIKNKEFKPILVGEKNYTPIEMSKFVHDNYEKLAQIIPGKVQSDQDFPLTGDELAKLYETNKSIDSFEEKELNIDLPDSNLLTSPDIFKRKVSEKISLENDIKTLNEELQCNFSIDENDIISFFQNGAKIDFGSLRNNNFDKLDLYFKSFKTFDKWKLKAILAGDSKDGEGKWWNEMVNLIEFANEKQDEIIKYNFDKNIQFSSIIDRLDCISIIDKLEDKIRKNGKLSSFGFLFDKQSKIFYDNITINKKPISTVEDCILLRKTFELTEIKQNLENLWDKLMTKNGMYKFSELDEEFPEKIAKNLIPDIKFALDWKKTAEKNFNDLIKSIGINIESLFDESEVFGVLDNDLIRLEKTLKFKFQVLPRYVEVVKIFYKLTDTKKLFKKDLYILSKENRPMSVLCERLSQIIKDENPDEYRENYEKLILTKSKIKEHNLRNKYLAKLREFAPQWAEDIENRVGIHGQHYPNENLQEGWLWKQFDDILNDILIDSYDALQKRYHQINGDLKETTVQLIVKKTWYHMLTRLQNNTNLKKNLTGWLQLKRKIGKGTGKRAIQLKKESKVYMKNSISAVPAWIMTTTNTMESLDLKREMFDIVIIDEASQSSIRDLLFLYIAKKVIIVGDDKQVSPINVGANITQIENLLRSTIRGKIPNHPLYDGRYSLYDITSSNFTSLMLIEHFRCVPDIIGYSNQLCYNDKIKPLRDANNSSLHPSVINYKVDGLRERKINPKEGETIISLLKSCINQEEYNDKSFGIISLLGEEQVKYIQKLLNLHFETSILEERKVKVGLPANFQGDERDIIFLTMVDNGDEDGPLSLKSDKEETIQRYNVAASRARDQMWIVNSLDVNKDLKQSDVRKQLIEYADNVQYFKNTYENVNINIASEFEKALSEMLSEKGFNTVQKYEVGIYKIDMIVKDGDKKIAIECDGSISGINSENEIINDMERQTILERIGWKFIRIRGSEFYRNPQRTMEKIVSKLADFDIYPEVISKNKLNNKLDLYNRVVAEAQEIEKSLNNKPKVNISSNSDSHEEVSIQDY